MQDFHVTVFLHCGSASLVVKLSEHFPHHPHMPSPKYVEDSLLSPNTVYQQRWQGQLIVEGWGEITVKKIVNPAVCQWWGRLDCDCLKKEWKVSLSEGMYLLSSFSHCCCPSISTDDSSTCTFSHPHTHMHTLEKALFVWTAYTVDHSLC